MTTVLFSAKIPHRPPTHAHCLPLSLSPSPWSVLFSCSLLFAQNVTTKCPSIPQLSALCYELGEPGQPAHELDRVVTENKER